MLAHKRRLPVEATPIAGHALVHSAAGVTGKHVAGAVAACAFSTGVAAPFQFFTGADAVEQFFIFVVRFHGEKC